MSHMNTTNISTKSFEHHGKSSRTSKFPSSGLEKFLRIVGNDELMKTAAEVKVTKNFESHLSDSLTKLLAIR